ncbi:hypothetical protein [Puniceibacterium sp. IMCC21224]|uniref:hypothetical protein n=1 Tax=Puniceibacterium sp. IMCC21224 TaxID=1618204 RepID=UPI00064D9CCF|nr:hypothetical protein [Puniceibacterium sp. IMCC21224]KMK65082.1 hypothetical protein IMCC21224_12327 [Puniceibacterium sp. IMCC21224]
MRINSVAFIGAGTMGGGIAIGCLAAVQNLAGLGAFYAPSAVLIAAGNTNNPWRIEEGLAPLTDAIWHKIADRLRAALFLPRARGDARSGLRPH